MRSGSTAFLSSLVFPASLVIVLTSFMDLFVNRFLFRAGPEVLAHMNFDATDLAIVGTISLNFEQVVLFLITGTASYLLVTQGRGLSRTAGFVMVPTVVSSALLYAQLPDYLSWAASFLLLAGGLLAILLLAFQRAKESLGANRTLLSGFMFFLATAFSLPLYYRMSLLTGAAGLGSLPFDINAYELGIGAVWATTMAAFVYALSVRVGSTRTGPGLFLKAAIIPTLTVAPLLYGLLSSFFMTQIFALVIAMSTDFALSVYFVQVMVGVWWFLLTAAGLLVLKGRRLKQRALVQEGMGLLILMSTTFLFNYPYYLLLGLLGVLLITHPLSAAPGETTV